MQDVLKRKIDQPFKKKIFMSPKTVEREGGGRGENSEGDPHLYNLLSAPWLIENTFDYLITIDAIKEGVKKNYTTF